MWKESRLYCDRCGREIKLSTGMKFDLHHEYCTTCAPFPQNGTNPSLIKRIYRFLKRWLW